MILDEAQQYIIMEQSGLPGGYGDSCAETSRYIILAYINGEKLDINLQPLVTDKGVLRHPLSPWLENDTPGDQVYPLIAAAFELQPVLGYKVIKQIHDAGNRTGNGDKISPGLRAQIRRFEDKKFLWFSDLTLVAQALIFKLPFRWSDSKKWFERSSGSSSDYLNFVNGLAFAKLKGDTWTCKLAKWLTSKAKVLEQIKKYYSPEPNSQWIIDAYTKALDRIY